MADRSGDSIKRLIKIAVYFASLIIIVSAMYVVYLAKFTVEEVTTETVVEVLSLEKSGDIYRIIINSIDGEDNKKICEVDNKTFKRFQLGDKAMFSETFYRNKNNYLIHKHIELKEVKEGAG